MSNLTPDQLKQIEANKQRALEKLRQKELMNQKTPTKKIVQTTINAYFSNPIQQKTKNFNKPNANAKSFDGSEKKKPKVEYTPTETKISTAQKQSRTDSFSRIAFDSVDENNEIYSPSKKCFSAAIKPTKSFDENTVSPIVSASQTPTKSKITNEKKTEDSPAITKEKRYEWLVDIKDKTGKRPDEEGYDKRTLFIPSYAANKFTSFEKQYWDIKKENFDTIVFFKKGKFYELYEKDAYIGNEIFDLKLTERVNMSMVGVPEASFERWVSKFIAKGYKVAKVDQMENSISKSIREKQQGQSASKIINRELTNIYSIGTLTDPSLINSDMSNYCLAVKEAKNSSNELEYGMAFVDAATAKFYLCFFKENGINLDTFICQTMPREILFEKGVVLNSTVKKFENSINSVVINDLIPGNEFLGYDASLEKIYTYFKVSEFPPVLNSHITNELVISALGALIHYLCNVKLDGLLVGLGNFEEYDFNNPSSSRYLALDAQTLLNLQVNQRTEKKLDLIEDNQYASIYEIVNYCYTPFGKRLLKQWVNKPLASTFQIKERQDAIMNIANSQQLESILCRLSNIPDLERLISRVHYKQIKIIEFINLIEAFQEALLIIETIKSIEIQSSLLHKLLESFPDIKNKIFYFKDAFDHDLAREEGLVVPFAGVEKDYDNINNKIAQLESEFESYLISQRNLLKCSQIAYKDVGKEIYQLEIPSSVDIPKSYIKLSQTKSCNRYWTAQLQELVKIYQETKELRTLKLKEIQSLILEKFDLHYSEWKKAADTIAVLDCLNSLSQYNASLMEPKTLPQITESDMPFIDIVNCRHPCLTLKVGKDFIPNDIKLGNNVANVCLISGPNMGGKSTILKQTCAIVILAQLGCQVPAQKCLLTPFNSIMSRIGANDNILEGKSTFYVELFETNRILKFNKKLKALAIIDELGRGTSTVDGYSIAYSCLHYLCYEMSNCLSLFTTHYTQLINDYRSLLSTNTILFKHMGFRIDETSRDLIVFMYKFVDGACPKSYGINVAKMANLQQSVIEEAKNTSNEMELKTKNHTRTSTLLSLGLLERVVKLLDIDIETESIERVRNNAIKWRCAYLEQNKST